MAAPAQYSGKGFILGGVTDEAPEWIDSFNQGVGAAQQQTSNRINIQGERQRQAITGNEEARRQWKFGTEVDAYNTALAANNAREVPDAPGFGTPNGPGLLPAQNIPAPVAPGPGLLPPEGGQPAPAAGSQALRDQMLPEWAKLENENALPREYLDRVAFLESSWGTNTGDGKYVGMFQIGPEVAKDFGITPEQARDPRVASAIAAKLAARNAQGLKQRLGRQPQGWELYLAHQQGLGGALALLQNPTMSAVEALTIAYGGDRARAQAAVVQNGGNVQMTAAQFAQKWAEKFSGAIAQPFTGGPSAAAGGTPSPGLKATPDPSATPLSNDLQEFVSKRNRREIYFGVIDQLRQSPLSGVYDYMFSDQATAEKNSAQSGARAEALAWFQQDDVGAFFDANPAALEQAAKDPIAFYQQNKGMVGGEVGPKGDIPAGVKLPGTPAAPLAPAATDVPVAGLPDPGVQPAPTGEIVPRVSREDYAGLPDDKQGSVFQTIVRTPAGQAPVLPEMGQYIVEPVRISNELQQLTNHRKTLEKRFAHAKALRDYNALNAVEDQIVATNAAINLMEGMQVIAGMQQGDLEGFARVLSGMTENRARIQPRSDGTLNFYYDGKLTAEGVTREQVIAAMRSDFDQRFQQQVSARVAHQQELEKETHKSGLKVQEKAFEQEGDAMKQIAIDRQKAAFETQLRQEYPAYKMSEGTDGRMYMSSDDGRPPLVFEMQPERDVYGDPMEVNGQPIMKLVKLGAKSAVPMQ